MKFKFAYLPLCLLAANVQAESLNTINKAIEAYDGFYELSNVMNVSYDKMIGAKTKGVILSSIHEYADMMKGVPGSDVDLANGYKVNIFALQEKFIQGAGLDTCDKTDKEDDCYTGPVATLDDAQKKEVTQTILDLRMALELINKEMHPNADPLTDDDVDALAKNTDYEFKVCSTKKDIQNWYGIEYLKLGKIDADVLFLIDKGATCDPSSIDFLNQSGEVISQTEGKPEFIAAYAHPESGKSDVMFMYEAGETTKTAEFANYYFDTFSVYQTSPTNGVDNDDIKNVTLVNTRHQFDKNTGEKGNNIETSALVQCQNCNDATDEKFKVTSLYAFDYWTNDEHGNLVNNPIEFVTTTIAKDTDNVYAPAFVKESEPGYVVTYNKGNGYQIIHLNRFDPSKDIVDYMYSCQIREDRCTEFDIEPPANADKKLMQMQMDNIFGAFSIFNQDAHERVIFKSLNGEAFDGNRLGQRTDAEAFTCKILAAASEGVKEKALCTVKIKDDGSYKEAHGTVEFEVNEEDKQRIKAIFNATLISAPISYKDLNIKKIKALLD